MLGAFDHQLLILTLFTFQKQAFDNNGSSKPLMFKLENSMYFRWYGSIVLSLNKTGNVCSSLRNLQMGFELCPQTHRVLRAKLPLQDQPWDPPLPEAMTSTFIFQLQDNTYAKRSACT